MNEEGLAIVGDVHGDAGRLKRALKYLTRSDRHIIFVGDYVNRGPDTRGVLNALCSLMSEHGERTTLLRGNHDELLLRFLCDAEIGPFVMSGGLSTVKSYYARPPSDVLDRFRREFPDEHLSLLAHTRIFHETEGLLVTHTGIDPDRPALRGLEVVALSAHPNLLNKPRANTLGKLIVFGHYVQQSGQPLDLGDVVCIDTGCGTTINGPLTVMLLPERVFIQF